VYQQDLEAGNGTHSPSPTGDEQDPKKGLSFAEALLMQVCAARLPRRLVANYNKRASVL
jgi:hypothetical protein